MSKRESLKCEKGFRVKGESGFSFFERFVRFNKYSLVCYNAARSNVAGLSPHLPFQFQFQFHFYFSKYQNVLECFVTEQKAMLSSKITFGGDFDPSFSSFRDLYTVFKFLMFNKSKYQENR